ncbi:MAG: alpha/beta fold hydrolase, partial [Verrucomicrobiia bacterium]
LQGEKDKLVPIAHAEYPSRLAPTALLDTIRLPKQGHFVPWEQPQVMVDAIVRLLDHATTNAGH